MMSSVRAFILLICVSEIYCTRVKIENNGYKNILISLPHNIELHDRPKIVSRIEDMMRSSSVLLQMATKGRAYFSEVTFLIPHTWKMTEDDRGWKSTSFNSTTFMHPKAARTVDEADIVVTSTGQSPYVLHQSGCGRKAMRIILPLDFVVPNYDKGTEFLRLWSEYRYGVFPEGGFHGDEKYPCSYRTPDGKENKTTGCSDRTVWSSSLCNEGDKMCSDTSFTSSIMDQHLSPLATLFCEGSVSLGPRHMPESPSKHNLICKEEGTWFTVMKSPDFSNGRNAAPKDLQHATDVVFRFVREAFAPRVVVALEISPRMKEQERFNVIQASFYQFVYSTLPYGSEVTLLLFGGDRGVYVAKPSTILKSEDTRIFYVESQPFPLELPETENVSIAQLFDVVFQLVEDANDTVRKASPDIIIVTTESSLHSSAFEETKRKIIDTQSRLRVMLFPLTNNSLDSEGSQGKMSLHRLCSETGGELISLHAHAFGDLTRGFGKSIGNHNKEILILQDYLKDDDDVDLEVRFIVDESLRENLKVSLSFPHSDWTPLEYRRTILRTPSGAFLNFMRMDFLFAWMIDMTKPEIGEYILKFKRFKDRKDPVLLTITGRSLLSEEPITVNVWGETLNDFDRTPHPIRIHAEIRKGWEPVRGASVTASVKHPDGQTSQLALLDNGLGDIDITGDDGIYGRYFTHFTTPGYYNVYVKATQGSHVTEVVKGPNGFCCGSLFSAVTTDSVSHFQREAGPFTFEVRNTLKEDAYPPSRVTDLRLNSTFDRICVLHWTAAGDDYDSGSAETYELKVFRDMAALRNRFSSTGLEVYREMITSDPEAHYGTLLNHAFELPKNLKSGVYFVAIRAIDDAGNAGEPSNTVPVFIERPFPESINCEKDCENNKCEKLPDPIKLKENAARNLKAGIGGVYIPINVLIPISSLIISLTILNMF